MIRRAVIAIVSTALLLAGSPAITRAATVTLVGAGDIAVCGGGEWDVATGNLIEGIAGTVFTAGDNAYPDGTATNFAQCYDPAWGSFKSRTRPAPGNHDYHTAGATGYFGYFGAQAGPAGQGYYAYDLGDWRIYSLNSEILSTAERSWLQNDLDANPHACVAAYWHHPLFSSGQHNNDPSIKPLWDILYAEGADLIINGHDHDYERFGPQTPAGVADTSFGIRELVVGTGGAGMRGFTTIRPNSQVRSTGTNGVVELTLTATGYSGAFRPANGPFTDSFSGTCHGVPGGSPPPPPPTGFTLSGSVSNGDVHLSWTAVSGTTQYRVRRAIGSGSYSTLVKLGGSTTSYTDTSVSAGTTYRYRLVAVTPTSTVRSNTVSLTP